ncbi:hypothetical protein Aglo03_33590 [Actinokineospora globicatena]|uniref:Uncharacterized protein n=1 Tax=Actinokineospora globicatena TaxID=103729 RepID=A0A9W6QLA9_9PSEU|nr:hypothetical protein Aglo03_33590 [Actinokineospora globicatena]
MSGRRRRDVGGRVARRDMGVCLGACMGDGASGRRRRDMGWCVWAPGGTWSGWALVWKWASGGG